MVGIPDGGEDVGAAWPHVHSNRGRLTQHDVRHGRNSQNMWPARDAVVVPATRTMFATVWPSILRLAATFQPNFATLITMRRPPGLVVLATETAEKKMRIRRHLLM